MGGALFLFVYGAGAFVVSWNDDIDLSEYELWTNGEPVTGTGDWK